MIHKVGENLAREEYQACDCERDQNGKGDNVERRQHLRRAGQVLKIASNRDNGGCHHEGKISGLQTLNTVCPDPLEEIHEPSGPGLFSAYASFLFHRNRTRKQKIVLEMNVLAHVLFKRPEAVV